MTNFQKAFCVLMSLCFFVVLALVPEPFFLQENIYRQLPLYCFLEKKALSVPLREDPETYEKIIAANTEYLGRQVSEENRQSQLPKELDNQSGESVEDGEKVESSKEAAPYDEPETAISQEREDAEKGREDGKSDIEDEESHKENEAPARENEESSPQDGETRAEDEEKIPETPSENNVQENTRETTGESAQEPQQATPRESYQEEEVTAAAVPGPVIEPHPVVDLSPESLSSFDYLLGQFYIVDPNTATNADQLNAAQFLSKDLTLQKDAQKPQILIYHSHSQETFVDSREGVVEDTIVGVGDYLTELLTETYGYQVLHVKENFDIIDGELDRSRAYDFSREYVEQVLKENPSVEVIIDLHRDGVPEDRRLVTQINGKDTAQIMFYNGLSYTVNNGPVEYLPNPYIQDNLAFSFQLEYQAAMYYPDLYRGIYLAGLRYNLHLRPRALLLEAGAQTNTVQEVKNAMEPFADILNRVLEGTG